MKYDRTVVDRDIANLKAALAVHGGRGRTDGFLPVVAPASTYWLENDYYDGDDEAFVFALADALG